MFFFEVIASILKKLENVHEMRDKRSHLKGKKNKPMFANQDEAQRCLDTARRLLSFGDRDGALRYIQKSLSLFSTPEALRMQEELRPSTTPLATAAPPDRTTQQTILHNVTQHLVSVGIPTQYHNIIFVVYGAVCLALVWRMMGYGPLSHPPLFVW